MVPRLKKVDTPVADKVDDSMLFGKPSRPGTAWEILERFGLPDSRERIAQNRLHKIKRSERDLSVRLHPVLQIVDELRLEHGHPFSRACGLLGSTPLLGQGRALFGGLRLSMAATYSFGLWTAPRGDVRRSSETA